MSNLRHCVVFALVLGAVLALGGCFKRKTDVERWIAKGDEFFEKGDFEAATGLYNQALAKQPENPLTLSRLARVAYHEGRTVSAYVVLQVTAPKVPDDLGIQRTFALASHALGRTVDARRTAKLVLEKHPDMEDMLIVLAETCLTTRDANETARIIDASRTKVGDRAAFHVASGILSAGRREDAAAEEEFRRALALDARSAAAHAELGALLLRRGDSTAARSEYGQAAALSDLRSPRRIRYIEFLVGHNGATEARKEIDGILAQCPDFVPAWGARMKLDFAEGKLDESLEATAKIIGLDRANYEAWMQRIAIKLRRNDLDGAIEDLKRVEAFYDRAADVKYQLALALLAKGEPFTADQYVQKALRLSPNNADAILLKAHIDLARRQPAAVVTSLTKLLEKRPQEIRTYPLLATAYRMAGDAERSVSALRLLAESFPKSPDAHYRLGVLLLELDRTTEAKQALGRSLELADNYWPALEVMMSLDLAERRDEDARHRVEEAIRKYPKESAVWLIRARLHLNQRDFAGAESDLSRVIALAPRDSHAYQLLARLYLAQGRVTDSDGKLRALTQQQPSADAFTQLGMLQSIEQQFEPARRSYERAIALDPQFAPALNNLAMLYAERLGQLDRAAELIKRARAASPDDPVVADTAGWILVRRGFYQSGLQLLQAAAERLPSDAEVRYHLGMAHYYLGNDADARPALRDAAAAVNFPARADAATRLAVLDIDPLNPAAGARDQLDTLVRKDPRDSAAAYRLAVIQAKEGRMQEAASAYEKVLAVNPRDLRAVTGLIDLYFGPVPNRERGKELVKAARELAPNDSRLMAKLGRILFGSGEWVTANGILQECAREFASDREFQFVLAQSQYSLGRIPDASAALAIAAATPPGQVPLAAAERMAALLAAAESATPAPAVVAQAEQILKAEPTDVPALMVRGIARARAGDGGAARQDFEKILSIYPQFYPAMRQLAVLYGDLLGDDAQAEEWARKVLKLAPEDAEANFQIGAVQFRRGTYDEAVRFLSQAAGRRPAHGITQYYLGMAYFQLRNSGEARAALERALQLKLPPQETGEATRTLEALARTPRN